MYRKRVNFGTFFLLAIVTFGAWMFPSQVASQGRTGLEVEAFSPVGIWDWTKRESTRDSDLYLVWVYQDGTGVARDGGCRAAITFRWEWDRWSQTLTMIDPNVAGNEAELFFRDQQVDRSYGARTMTPGRSIHAPGRKLEGLRKPVRGDLLTVIPDPFTGLMHWGLWSLDTSGKC